MIDFQIFRHELALIKNERDSLDKQRKKLIIEVTNACEHPIEYCRELNYCSDWWNSSFPFIICTKCGYCEEGWGCGYIKFRGKEFNLPKITSEEFYNLRTRCIFQKRSNDKERPDRTY